MVAVIRPADTRGPYVIMQPNDSSNRPPCPCTLALNPSLTPCRLFYSLYRTTMASDLAVSADELPSTDELMACWRRCTDLRQAVKERQAGGTALARAVVAASFVSSFDVQAAAVPSLGLGQCRHWRSSNLW